MAKNVSNELIKDDHGSPEDSRSPDSIVYNDDEPSQLEAERFDESEQTQLIQSIGQNPHHRSSWSTAERLLLASCALRFDGEQNKNLITKNILQKLPTLGPQYERHDKEFYAPTKCARQLAKLIGQMPKFRRGDEANNTGYGRYTVEQRLVQRLREQRVAQLDTSISQRIEHIIQIRKEIDDVENGKYSLVELSERLSKAKSSEFIRSAVRVGPVRDGTYTEKTNEEEKEQVKDVTPQAKRNIVSSISQSLKKNTPGPENEASERKKKSPVASTLKAATNVSSYELENDEFAELSPLPPSAEDVLASPLSLSQSQLNVRSQSVALTLGIDESYDDRKRESFSRPSMLEDNVNSPSAPMADSRNDEEDNMYKVGTQTILNTGKNKKTDEINVINTFIDKESEAKRMRINEKDKRKEKPRTEIKRSKPEQRTSEEVHENMIMLVRKLSKCSFAFPFRKPVSLEDAPNYPNVVAFPDDLSSLRLKLTQRSIGPLELKATVFRIAANAMIFNGRDSEFFVSAHKLKEECKFLCASLGLDEAGKHFEGIEKDSPIPPKPSARKRSRQVDEEEEDASIASDSERVVNIKKRKK